MANEPCGDPIAEELLAQEIESAAEHVETLKQGLISYRDVTPSSQEANEKILAEVEALEAELAEAEAALKNLQGQAAELEEAAECDASEGSDWTPADGPEKYADASGSSSAGGGADTGAQASTDFGGTVSFPNGADQSIPFGTESFEIFKNGASELFTGVSNFFEPVITMMSNLWANTAVTLAQSNFTVDFSAIAEHLTMISPDVAIMGTKFLASVLSGGMIPAI